MTNFIQLRDVCGNSLATETTVQLFNSVRRVQKDVKGRFMVTAIKPHLNGVIVEKQYI